MRRIRVSRPASPLPPAEFAAAAVATLTRRRRVQGALAAAHERARAVVDRWRAALGRRWDQLEAQIGAPPLEDAAMLSFWVAGCLALVADEDGRLTMRLAVEMLPERRPAARLRRIVQIAEVLRPPRTRCVSGL